jgi:hypothetical protein
MALDFTWSELTAALLKSPYMPGQVGRLGLFTPRPQSTTTAHIEQAGERLALVPEVPRGAPPTPNVLDRRSIVQLPIPHFPIRDTIYADAVQDMRGFGALGLQSFPGAVQQRIDSLGRRLDVTLEHLRLGALRGLVVTQVDRATGSPLKTINLFDAFEVAAQPIRDWPIVGAGEAGDAAAWNGQLTLLVNSLGRAMANELPSGFLAGIHGFCGSVFFDAFSGHPENRAAYIGFPSAATVGPLRGNAVTFRDVTIEEYRGGLGLPGVPFVATNECHFVALGIPELFIEIFAPADYNETVNTLGLARYLKREDIPFDKGVELEAQMNVLPICTSPRSLFTARATPYEATTGAVATPRPTPPTPPARRAA